MQIKLGNNHPNTKSTLSLIETVKKAMRQSDKKPFILATRQNDKRLFKLKGGCDLKKKNPNSKRELN